MTYRLSIGVLGLCILLLPACSLRFNEEKVPPATISVSSSERACLSEAGNTLNDFFEGKASDPAIDGFFYCLQKSIYLFLENARGQDPNRYDPKELAGFVSKYFLNGKEIPEGFLRELMKLKKGIFGGSTQNLTRDEVYQIVHLFGAFSSVAKKVNPYMPLTPDVLLGPNVDEDKFSHSLDALEAASLELGDVLKGSLGEYSISDFVGLMNQTEVFMKSAGWEIPWKEKVYQWIELLPPLKGALVSQPKNIISKEDWAKLFYLVPRYYGLFLRYKLYFDQPKSFIEGEGLYLFSKIFDESVYLIESSLNGRKSGKITGEEIEEILDQLIALDLVKIKKKEILTVLTLLVNKVIPDSQAKGRLQFSLKNLSELKTLYSYYTDGKRMLEGIFKQTHGSSYKNGEISFSQTVRYANEDLSQFTIFNNESTKVAKRDLQENIANVDLVFDKDLKAALVPVGSPKMSFFHLDRMHLFRILNKVVMRSYGSSRGSISEKQIKIMLKEFSPFLDFLKIDSKSVSDILHSRLYEASLFLPHSDGSVSLRLNEAMEFEVLLLSAVEQGDKIHREIAKVCKTSRRRSGGYVVDAQCYRRTFAYNSRVTWRVVPALATAFQEMTMDQRADAIGAMDPFLRSDRMGASYTQSDSRGLILIGYYIELLFFRFDKDRNGVFDQDEVKKAYPLFEPIIAKKAKELGRTDPKEFYKIYTYILAKRKIPTTLGEKLGYLNWKAENPFTTNRMQIMEIFSTLMGK
ncbi:MAG: hypothetical protein M9962_00260 [Oligoflexia bacterium]|nr:hypothetical protein [Oligoflexia bacterium]